MKRIILLATLVAVGSLSLGVAAFQQPPATAPKVVEAQKLRDNLWMLTGQNGGGNTAVFVRSDGITVVDTKNPGWGQPILDKIKELSDKPVTTIINTHTHGDHVSGNVEFPATVEVIVAGKHQGQHDGDARRDGHSRRPGRRRTSSSRTTAAACRPGRSASSMKVGKGADEIDLHYFGRGHTNGDAWVVFPALRAGARRRHLLGQEPAAPRREQRRQRRGDRRHAREGREVPERQSRHGHHRPQHAR